MATFGKDFVRSATQPAYLQGLFTAAQGLGSMPRRRREEEEKQERLGMLRNLSPVEAAQYRINTAKTEQELLAGQQALQTAKTADREDLMRRGGESINAMVGMLITETDPTRVDMIEKGIREVAGRSGRNVAAIENQLVNIRRQKTTEAQEQEYNTFFDTYVPDDKKEEYRGLTKAQILAKLDSERDVNKAREWANWRTNNKINNENRQEAINLAVEVFGSRAAEEVASLEANQLNAELKGRKKKVIVTYQGDADPFLGTPGKKKTKTQDITLDEDGKVPQRFEDMWKDTATSVTGVDFDYVWSPDPIALTTPTTSPTQPTGSALTPRQLRELQQGKK